MKLPRLAATRPVTVSMLVFVAVLMGIVSLTRLSVDLLPEMNIPVAAVATSYEGAGPAEVETLVSRPIEEVVATVGNVKKVSSISARGSSVVIAEFDWGTDMDFATLDLREKVDLIRPLLPDDAGSPRVLTFDPSSAPILELGMGGARDLADLKRLAEDVVKNRLERIAGVASIRVLGGRNSEIHILADAALMKSYGITFDHITQTLQAANLNLPGGRMDIGSQEVTIRTTGELKSLEEFETIFIPTATGLVPLKDVARITFGYSDIELHSRLNGRPGIWLEVMKETGANTVQVAEAVQEAVQKLQAELGNDIQFVTVSDESRFIRGSLESVSQNAIMGGILAMAVLFAFLRNFRTTVIIGLAIPISIVFSFLLIYLWDMTLNMMSLGGLALGIGMLVDNGIVVIENIFRHRAQGKNALDAADHGTVEVGTAIIASTLTTVSVFIPVIFIQGLASQIFRDLSLSVTFSLVASLVVSLTLIPMLAAKMLGNTSLKLGDASLAAATGETKEIEASDDASKSERGMYRLYGTVLRSLLGRRWLLYIGIVFLMAASLFMVPRIGQEFLPPFDEGQVVIDIEMPKGTGLDETNRVVSQVEDIVFGLPDVQAVLATAGSSDAPDMGRVSIHLVEKNERRHHTETIVEMVRRQTADIPGATISVSSSSGFMSGLGGAAIQVELRGDDLDELKREAERLAQVMADIPGTRDVKTSANEGRPELQVHVDRERASRLNLTVAQIDGAVRKAVRGQAATVYRVDGEEIDVVVRLERSQLQNVQDLYQIPLGTPFGVVPLSEVATLNDAASPISIDRADQSRAVAVTANLSGRDLGSVMSDIRASIAEMQLPPHIEVAYTGEDQQMQEAFGDLGIALVLAIILVYAVLASQFESLVQPLAIIFTIPFAFIGVIWGLVIFGHTLNVAAIVGVIMLAGIAVNNAIVLIDFINQLRQRGMDLLEAVMESGRTRLRPILMTTLTTILGMLPLLLGIGEGSEVMAPLAVVVVGGLITSTFLTLTVIPSLYVTLDHVAAKVRGLGRKTVQAPNNRLFKEL